ncbi:MAG: aminopeptidase [Bacteroidales bacterium]|nr:aminopeptidase [Bacteroidales bacterium]
MRNLLLSAGLALMASAAMAQSSSQFVFKDVLRLNCPDIQDQGYSGTCWCFSATSFLESEMMANGVENPPNLSEMFVVRHNYIDRARKYVMLEGKMSFGEGSYFWDVVHVGKQYGLVPESAMPNIPAGQQRIDHSTLVEMAKAYADSVATISEKAIDTNWVAGYTSLIDRYFSNVPSQFTYNGRSYTPREFADSVCRINFNDYVQVTSFSHHEFNKYCMLELPDNWRWSKFFNVPVDDLIAIIDSSLAMGHTVLWAPDVSETGFNIYRGTALLPGINPQKQADRDEFLALPIDKQRLRGRTLLRPGVETAVTQESRQTDFLNKKTTDDHGMHIIGLARDQEDNEFYIVKNSWGNTGKYKGYFYVSKNYVKAKTTGLMVNKCAMGDRLVNAEWE